MPISEADVLAKIQNVLGAQATRDAKLREDLGLTEAQINGLTNTWNGIIAELGAKRS